MGLRAATNYGIALLKKHRLHAFLLLAVAPAILLIAWIDRCGINVPVADDWVMVPTFEKWQNDQLTFADLYKQHNEHRMPVPKLLYLAFAHLTNWNLRAEMFFSVALCAGTSAGIYILLRRTVGGAPRQLLLLWGASNLLIFSPAQAEGWLLGFGVPMYIANFSLVTALVVLTSGLNWWVRFAASVLLIGVATFSFGNGLLLWPLVALLLSARGESKWGIVAWLLASCVAVALYFAGYYHVPRAQLVAGNWLDYPRYFLAFIGGALARERQGYLLVGAIAAGAIVAVSYAAALLRFVWSRGEALRNAAPWLTLGGYVIGSAALAAYSRVNWGPEQAMDSRYVVVSNSLYLALMALAAIAVRDAEQRHPAVVRAISTAKIAVITAIVVLTLAGYPAGLQEMVVLGRERLVGLAALQFSKVLDTAEPMHRYLRMIPGFAPTPSEYVAVLERFHLLGYRRRASAVLKDAAEGTRVPSAFGRVDAFQERESGAFEISGWAILPESSSPAPLVVLAYHDGERWRAFGHCEVEEVRHDVVASLHSRDYLSSGWRRSFLRSALPPEAERISAWAVDPLKNRVHRLSGEHSLRR